jgi:cytochrome c oxidase subunit 1
LYFFFGLFASVFGSGMSQFIRIELSQPGSFFFMKNYQMYNVMVTGHAIVMVFFLAMPILIGAFGN